MTLNVCRNEGWLVNDRALSTDPVEHDAELLPRVGCTNIRCALCGAVVRSIGGYSYASPAGNMDVDALYSAENLAASPQLKPWKGARTYTCTCAWHVEFNEQRLDDKEGPPVAFQWTCTGHPLATLPRAIDGVMVTNENLDQVAANAVKGVYDSASSGVHGMRAARLCVRLASTPGSDRVAAVVAAHLTDPVVEVRVRAVDFFYYVRSKVPLMNAEVLLSRDAPLFANVANPRSNLPTNKTLEMAIWRIVAEQLPTNSELRALAHAHAMDNRRSTRALFLSLAQQDGLWFAENADSMSKANPDRVADLLYAARVGNHPTAVSDSIRRAAG